MITTCPSCATRFRVDDALLGAGRRVRCSACGTVWYQAPEDDGWAAPVEPEPAGSSFSDLVTEMERTNAPAMDEGEVAAAPLSLGRLRPAPVPPPAPAKRFRAVLATARWGVLAAVVLGGGTALVLERDAVIGAWPAAARLYDTLGMGVEAPGAGLEMVNSKTEYRDVEGTSMLFIEITVQNKSDRQRAVPDLMASALGKDGKPFQTWRMQPQARHLFPGEKTAYRGNFVEKGGQAQKLHAEFVAPQMAPQAAAH